MNSYLNFNLKFLIVYNIAVLEFGPDFSHGIIKKKYLFLSSAFTFNLTGWQILIMYHFAKSINT